MAKKKNEKAEKKSPFVPAEEQPYQVPGNWCWTYLSTVAQWGSGGTPSRKHADYYNGDIPWIKTGELNNAVIFESEEKITQSGLKNSNAKLFPINTVMIAMYGATIGKTGVLGINATTNQACACGVCTPALNYMYLFYYAQSQQEAFIRKGKGGAQPNISQTIITSHEIPLAPLAEQQRIVDCIESLFAKLDEAKEKTQEALESFEERRSAILQSAFTGKLTENWRERHKKKYSWKCVRFDEAAHIRSNLVEPAKYNRLPHIAPDNIEKKTGRLLEYHTIEEDDVTSGKHHFYPGQILYSKIRPYLSKVVLIDFEGLCSADMYPIEAVGKAKFLWYQMLSDDFLEQASNAGSRSVLPKINQKELSAIKVSVTRDKDEEAEIVRILDDFFAKEAEAKAKVEETLDAIETMKKSILAMAFRGELGTNNPEDESAEDLLKRTLE